MSLDSLCAAIDALDPSSTPLQMFLRDDDAGWDDARLMALLDTTGQAGVPIDLAAIPTAVTTTLAKALNGRLDATPGLLGVHQHGTAHTNHQTEGRSCEFGDARDAAAQRVDLARGRTALLHHFGPRLDPFFTPPWNRCAPYTPGLLANMGYVAISRDRGAVPQQALHELPVDVDWTKHHRAGGAAAVAEALAQAVSARRLDGQPLGLMLHHAVMDDSEFELLGRCLQAMVQRSPLRFRSMRSLIAERLVPNRPAALA
ncbi:hypothetical protein [Ideonella sp. A 288]|uniref:hypothetical protein n=1 Tax=Ideonella sp. A 288 TaxID=1962181 RepID=UPI000B4A79FB|nr:hypothetical protein [Ideonella sp. A 288]